MNGFTPYTRVIYAELCRLCATHQPGEMMDIFKEQGITFDIKLEIQKIANIKVTTKDNLPKVICLKCFTKLEDIQKFRKQCKSSEGMLNNFLSKAQNVESFKKSGTVYIPNSWINHVDGNIQQQIPPLTSILVNKTTNPRNNSKVQIIKQIQLNKPNNKIITSEQTEASNIKFKSTPNIVTIQVLPHPINTKEEEPDMQELQVVQENLEEINIAISKEEIVHPPPITEQPVQEKLHPRKKVQNIKTITIPTNYKELRRYNCTSCGKFFKRREHLFQHSKTHSGIRPYKCGYCTKTFVRKEHLLRHELSHTGQKNYACDICSKSFSRSDNLLKHRKIHEKDETDPLFLCKICRKFFLLKHHYEQHMLTAHGFKENLNDLTNESEAGNTIQMIKVEVN